MFLPEAKEGDYDVELTFKANRLQFAALVQGIEVKEIVVLSTNDII